MSQYYIKAIILENCPYSENANQLLNIHKIPCQKIIINNYEKENYKSENISTFPQIYLNKYNSKGNLLLGGYSDLKEFIDAFKNVKYNENNINKFMMKYKWSKKATLRLIELINL